MSRKLDEGPIAIAGAGSVGLYVGGALTLAGRQVRFLGRERVRTEIATHGLRLTDLDGLDHRLAPAETPIETDPAAALAGARIVLVCVKSGATETMARLVAAAAPQDAIILSLQNGVGNAELLRRALGERAEGGAVLAGVAPFNLLQMGEGRIHRGVGGVVRIEDGVARLAEVLSAPGLSVRPEPDIEAVLWGKLLVNLNNALNALSGLPLKSQLEDRRWRRLLAASMEEGLDLLRAAGITARAASGPVPPALIPFVLRLPTPVFRPLAGAMLRIDPEARSSMWEDLARGRPTEIDALQGALVGLAARQGRRAPLAARIASEIRKAEAAAAGSPRLSPEAIAR